MLRVLVSTTLLVLLMIQPAAGAPRDAERAFPAASISTEGYVARVEAFQFIVDGSYSMRASTHELPKIDVARAVAQSLAQAIPPLDYRGGVRAFGQERQYPAGETSLLYGVQRYSPSRAREAIGEVRCAYGDSPLATALDAAGRDLASASGETAVFVVSDGLDMGDEAVAAARRLHERANACIYAVQVGVSRDGSAMLQRLVNAGGCGEVVQAWDLTDPRQMRALVVHALLSGDGDRDGVPDDKDRCLDTPKGTPVTKEGCPVRGLEVSGEVWRLPVRFAFDSSSIDGEYRRALDEIATYLKHNPEMRLVVEGHADDQGDDAYNQVLSERRAQSTRDYLVSRGVPPSQLSVAAYGESQPLVINSSKENRARNRRTQFRVIGEPAVTSR
jgi:OmpA-OmpF porin, OOP family